MGITLKAFVPRETIWLLGGSLDDFSDSDRRYRSLGSADFN